MTSSQAALWSRSTADWASRGPGAALDICETTITAAFARAGLRVLLTRAECKLGRRWLFVDSRVVRATLTPGGPFAS